MIRFLLVVILIIGLVALAGVVSAQSISLTGPNRVELLEGNTYAISWKSDGIKSVGLLAYGTRTPLGKASRGQFQEVIADVVPAGRGKVSWRAPWVDSITLFIKAKGYDANGRMVVTAERGYNLRPAVMAHRFADGLYLDLHSRSNQRLYIEKDHKITHAYISSSSENYYWLPPGKHVSKPHDHAGVFKVLDKSPDHYSKLFHVHMYWAMRYLGGHYIHATSRALYGELGRPASHGCNRLTRTDAKAVYQMTPVGTRVEVIGPGG